VRSELGSFLSRSGPAFEVLSTARTGCVEVFLCVSLDLWGTELLGGEEAGRCRVGNVENDRVGVQLWRDIAGPAVSCSTLAAINLSVVSGGQLPPMCADVPRGPVIAAD
jgi:hypothetical protein